MVLVSIFVCWSWCQVFVVGSGVSVCLPVLVSVFVGWSWCQCLLVLVSVFVGWAWCQCLLVLVSVFLGPGVNICFSWCQCFLVLVSVFVCWSWCTCSQGYGDLQAAGCEDCGLGLVDSGRTEGAEEIAVGKKFHSETVRILNVTDPQKLDKGCGCRVIILVAAYPEMTLNRTSADGLTERRNADYADLLVNTVPCLTHPPTAHLFHPPHVTGRDPAIIAVRVYPVCTVVSTHSVIVVARRSSVVDGPKHGQGLYIPWS